MQHAKPLICFFDSGIGGLNLLCAAARRLPFADMVYFSDNKNVPYGSLSQERLEYLTDAVFDGISELNPDVAVVACNTVTARCIDRLRSRYSFPIVGIQPAIKPAASVGGNCLVLATPSTAASPAVNSLLERFGRGITHVAPCPELAGYIEENIFNLDEEEVVARLPHLKAESVVLGCTHYIFIKDIAESFYGCPVFDGVDGTVERIAGFIAPEDRFFGLKGEISFNGGDEQKNALLYKRMFCGEIFPKKYPKIPKKTLTMGVSDAIINLQTQAREYFMLYLTGEYEHQMDTKNRIRIPNKLKGEERGLYFSKGVNHCINVYTAEGFAKLIENLNASTDISDPDQMLANRIFAKSFIWVDGDAQGRMILPTKLKEYAKIDRDIMICGAIDHMEIWAKSRYEDYYKDEDEHFDELFYKLAKKR